jgi:penicillin G amidase
LTKSVSERAVACPNGDRVAGKPSVQGLSRLRISKRLRRIARVVVGLVAVGAVVGLVAALWLFVQVRASIARYDGSVALLGLESRATVERDGLGVPTVRGTSLEDVVRATGFVHAQERFFQMDLMRRQSAGELAALLGPSAARGDRTARLHRFRFRAHNAVEALPAPRHALLSAYSAGVNAGLRDLGHAPPEYMLLRAAPEPWSPEDSFLVIYTMYLRLQDPTDRLDSTLETLFDTLPPQLATFLAPPGTRWDAPVAGEAFQTPPIPGPEVLDLRQRNAAILSRRSFADLDAPIPGSNSWVVSGDHAVDGALLANDMHLGLGIPNVWYRLVQRWTEHGQERQIIGVSLAGFPVVLAGSTGRIAWGFTNSQGDWSDLVVLDVDPSDASRYLTPAGAQPFLEHKEIIAIKGAEPQSLSVRETIWGPVVDADRSGRPRVAHWVAHLPGAVNLEILTLIEAETVDDALDAAHRAGLPAQNLVVVDRGGRIGWTIIGPVPSRRGTDGRLPASWADGTVSWDGWLNSGAVPQIVNPPAGRIWTANARVVSGQMLEVLGDGGYALGARAKQIRDSLMAIEGATPPRMLELQLDDRAVFLEPWHTLMLQVLTQSRRTEGSRIDELLRRTSSDWTGRASVDSVAYRLVREWRSQVAQRALLPLVAACVKADPDFDYLRVGDRIEGPLWELVSRRPDHLLDPKYTSWDELFLDAAEGVLHDLVGDNPEPSLARFTWGARNTFALRHPLSGAVPGISRLLDIPARPFPGDSHMPRVQGVGFGASVRFVVSPGHEEQGILEMPGGQSGHPLSPFYRAGHESWAEGRLAPFLPGPTVHTLTLTSTN